MMDRHARGGIDGRAEAANADRFTFEIFALLNARQRNQTHHQALSCDRQRNHVGAADRRARVVLPAMARNSISPAIIAAMPPVPLGNATRSMSSPYFLNSPASLAAQYGAMLPESEA